MTLAEVFVQVCRMSAAALIVAVPVMALALVFDWLHVPKKFSCLLFALVLFRMVCPVALPGQVSLFNAPLIQEMQQSAAARFDGPAGDYESHVAGTEEYDRAVAAGVAPEKFYDDEDGIVYYKVVQGEIRPADRAMDTIVPVLAKIWLAGMAAFYGFTLLSYFMLKRRLRFAVKQEGNVYVSDRIPAPCLVGYFRPRIYLVPGLSGEERAHIIAHERAHLRAGDHWAKLIAWLALGVHWFNLLLWSVYGVYCARLEGACDERVIRGAGDGVREAYSQTLLNLSCRRRFLWLHPVSFGEGGTKERVKAVLRYKRPRPAVLVLAVAAAAALFLICATGGGTEKDVLRVQINKDTASIAVADYSHTLTEEQMRALAEVLGEGQWSIGGSGGEWLNRRVFSTLEIEEVSVEESALGHRTYTISGWGVNGFGAWLPPDAAAEEDPGIVVVSSVTELWYTYTVLWDGKRFVMEDPDITTGQMIREQLLMNLLHGTGKGQLSWLQCWQAEQYFGCETVYPMEGSSGRLLIVEQNGAWRLLQTRSRKELASGDFGAMRTSEGIGPGVDLSGRTTWELVRALPACTGDTMAWVLMEATQTRMDQDPLSVFRAVTALGEEDRETVCRLIANQRWLVAQATGPDMGALWVEYMEELAQMDGVAPAVQDTVKRVIREYEKFETGENTDAITDTGWVIAGPIESGTW